MEYSAKEICAYWGIATDALRKWETRHQLVLPRRAVNGYRMYSVHDVERLRLFRKFRSSGLAAGPAADLAKRTYQVETQYDAFIAERAWQAIVKMDYAALNEVFIELADRKGVEGAFQNIWLPLFEKVGICGVGRESVWVGREHFAIFALRSLLLRQMDIPPHPPAAQVAIASPEGEWHELGLLVASYALWQRGVSNLYLGPNLPIKSLMAVLAEKPVQHLCLGLNMPLLRKDLRKMVRMLKKQQPNLQIYFAGRGSLPLANVIARSGAVFLGTHLGIGLEILTKNIQCEN